jgi:membrane fusion protein, copper/silver efflux system
MSERLRDRLARARWRTAAAMAAFALVSFGLGALTVRSCGARHDEAEHVEHDDPPERGVFTCAMHPQIRRPEPGQCPICGMALIPVGAAARDDESPHRISLSERAKALAKVRTTEVRRMSDPSAEVRLLGRVEADESSSRAVTAWVAGRIDRLHVNVTGERVRAGQTIATLYSPEVLAAHQDLIAARRQVERMGTASETARAAAESALEAARDRLSLLGVPKATLREMESAASPTRSVPIRSPFAGTVIERMVAEGAYVQTGEPLFRIANLTKVWVQLDAYERDLASIREGQEVAIAVDALPGEAFEGRVAFVDPTIDPTRRTARVRVEAENPERSLRPGMFVQGVVRGQAAPQQERPLVVPRTAPLFTGRRSIVYVEIPGAERPTYEARVVRLGPRAGDVYPVVAGLEEGERVVTRGAFVIDADLQIRGGSSMMTGADDTDESDGSPVPISAAERKKLEPVVSAYLELQRALAADDLAEARLAASALAESAARTQLALPPNDRDAWAPIERSLVAGGQRIAYASSLEAARGPFEAISGQIKLLLGRFGNPLGAPLRAAFCPMAGRQGSEWIQRGDVIDNPYFGSAMRECGEIRETVVPEARLPLDSVPARPAGASPAEGHRH